jgi:tetratricopeptide (TPR) repeat protein
MKKYHLISLMLIAASVSALAQSDRSLIRDGNQLYDDKKFTDAEVNYRKALDKNKELPTGSFNLGDALYREGRYDEAATQDSIAVMKSTDARSKAGAFHNLGNALLQSKKYDQSLEAYKESLKLNPNDDETRYNYEYAREMLKQQQQQQKNQKQDDKKDQKKDDKQKQDQQKQDQQKKDQDKQNQKNQDQQKQDQQKQDQQSQPKKGQISKADAARILEALKNEEKNVQKKLVKKVQANVSVQKDW